jgi:3-deoxy-manno-octulosonate cytidylyltransferase (CMP-KDO synthetase)
MKRGALAVIPARMGSTRLPGKPLLKRTGKYLIQYVYENAIKAPGVKNVIIATDSPQILRAVRQFGAQAVMTPSDCNSGTHRVAHVARDHRFDIVLNLQCDEPELSPEAIGELAKLVSHDTPIGTIAYRARSKAELTSPQRVKVVINKDGYAMYFSRSCIPYLRKGPAGRYLLHIGAYGFKRGFLVSTFPRLGPTPLEQAESLEQLRLLEHGFKIKVGVVDYAGSGIDTPKDYEDFVRRLNPST